MLSNPNINMILYRRFSCSWPAYFEYYRKPTMDVRLNEIERLLVAQQFYFPSRTLKSWRKHATCGEIGRILTIAGNRCCSFPTFSRAPKIESHTMRDLGIGTTRVSVQQMNEKHFFYRNPTQTRCCSEIMGWVMIKVKHSWRFGQF